MRKICLVLSIFALIFDSAIAQDIIVKKDGTTILAKVSKVSDKEIEYKKFKSTSDRIYAISTSEVMAVNYEDGDRDTFENTTQTVKKQDEASSQQKIFKPADSANLELLNIYNRTYQPGPKIKSSSKPSKSNILIFGIKTNSILSNEDIQMEFFRTYETSGDHNYIGYYIKLSNKTNSVIYIDRANCFRIEKNGTSYCYFDPSLETTVNVGGGSSLSLGLGGVTNALGIGGKVGQIAGGMTVGGGSSHSTSSTYTTQRMISIPPHGNVHLTEFIWLKANDKIFGRNYMCVEMAELFPLGDGDNSEGKELRHNSGINWNVKKGEVYNYTENNSPWTRDYLITYSKDPMFSSYSCLEAHCYLHQQIGCQCIFDSDLLKDKYISGNDNRTLVGYVSFYLHGTNFQGTNGSFRPVLNE